MRIITLLFSLFISLKSFCQYEDTWQSPAVYKQNAVKARVIMYDRARFKERAVVDYFDRNGYVTEHTEYDSTGKNPVVTENFSYDSSHRTIGHTIHRFQYYDTALKKFTPYNVTEEISVTNEYDAKKRLVKQTGKNAEGKIVFETAYDFSPLSKKISHFRNDSLISQTQIEYEVPWIERVYSRHFYFNGESSPGGYSFRYKNHLDKSGKITRRKVTYEGPNENCIYFREITYQYMLGGLLIRKESGDRSDGANVMMGQLFDYKFW